MSDPLFHIQCPTCEARLAVRNRALIGQILACPKCESMVQVTPPPDWEDAENEPPEVESADQSSSPLSDELPTEDEEAVADKETEQRDSESDFSPREKQLSPTERKTRTILWIASGILGALLLLGATILFWPKERPPESARTPAESSSPGPEKKPKKQENSPSLDTQGKEDSPSPSVEEPGENAASPEEVSPKDDPDDTSEATEKPDSQEPAGTTNGQEPSPSGEGAAEPSDTTEPVAPSEENGGSILPQLPTKQEEKPRIDIAERLQNPIEEIRFPGVPFIDAVAVLQTITGVPIQIDGDTLHWRGKTLTDPVDLNVQATTAGTVLEKVAETVGLTPKIGDRFILLALPEEERGKPKTVEYPVESLLESVETLNAAELVDLLQRMIAPESWQSAGGPGEIGSEQGKLIVRQTAENQFNILRLLERLRLIHQLDPQSSLSPEMLAPQAFGWDQLQKEITVNYLEPRPLREILDMIAREGGIKILIDYRALASVGLSPHTRSLFRLEKGTTADALMQLLSPIGLTFRILEHEVIEVTSQEKAGGQRTVEIHRYPPLENDETVEDLVATIKAMPPHSWGNQEKETAIWVDPQSECLVLRESQPFQRMVRKWLQEQRRDHR